MVNFSSIVSTFENKKIRNLFYFDLSDLPDEEWRDLWTNCPEPKVPVFVFRLQKELLVKLLILIKLASYMTF